MKLHDFATQGDCEAIRKALCGGAAVDARDEHDYTPLACSAKSPQADKETLRLLIGAGADVNALVDEGRHFPLELAACSGDLGKVEVLLDAGAEVNRASPKGYTAIIKAIYALHADEMLVPILNLLVKSGADINGATNYGEFPLGVASYQCRFDAVRYLLEVGADPSPLQWTRLMQAIAVGSCGDVERLLAGSAELVSRDRFGRTPLLLAACVDQVQKVALICSQGTNLNERGRMGDTALMLAAARSNAELVRWLLDHAADIRATDDAGNTALIAAAQAGSTDCVKLLLDYGADVRQMNSYHQNAMKMASNEATVRLLIEAGGDIADIDTEMKRALLGLHEGHVWTIGKSDYAAGCSPRFGTSNPEVIEIPFWHEMVKAGVSAYSAKMQFGETDALAGPVWCFSRFGMSFTELPDGRIVQVGGEHEDFYDPDFCIYNDVVVHDRSGNFTILGYPREVFPPTDFHSATYVNGVIYIVGGLGYQGERKFGTTPVHRLDSQTWRMETLPSSGDNPGWIFQHRASFDGIDSVTISGGTICTEVDGEEQHVQNEEQFLLNLRSLKWTRHGSPLRSS